MLVGKCIFNVHGVSFRLTTECSNNVDSLQLQENMMPKNQVNSWYFMVSHVVVN